jgi:hypothetical protein
VIGQPLIRVFGLADVVAACGLTAQDMDVEEYETKLVDGRGFEAAASSLRTFPAILAARENEGTSAQD